LSDLVSSVAFILRQSRLRAHVVEVGGAVAVVGPEPLGVATLVGHMPGVSWVAAGDSGNTLGELSKSAGVLARMYLRKGDGFSVEAEGGGGVAASDVGGSVTSKVLDSVKGARASAASPKVRFRAAFDGRKGVVGVQVTMGPGGVPTGREVATCLVSGGVHSSVTAWFAVLQGFGVRLVHAKLDDDSVMAVARLYSELSHRADPRLLSLEVLEGGSARGAIASRIDGYKGKVFAGFSRADRGEGSLGWALSPLYLLTEEWFQGEFEGLGLNPHRAKTEWDKQTPGKNRVLKFGGRTADVSGVLDGLA
jgi:hypothetical protein